MTSPAVPGAVPSAIDQVTAQWLRETLPDHPAVTAVRAERIAEDTGFSSSLYRLHVTGTDAPPSLIVKLPADSEARGAMALLGGYRRELAFYRHIAPVASIATAHCHVARIDGDDFVLVLEDLQGWDNADHLAGLSLERVHTTIGALADLHAWSVGTAPESNALQEFPNIDNPLTRDLFLPAFAPGWQLYLEKTRQPVPPAVADFAERFAELAPQALHVLSQRSMLLHGDIRADNLFFRGGQLKIVDFQLAVRGAGAADIAYLVSQGLPTSVRRGTDDRLVREYVAALERRGVTDYPFDEAWRDYRFAVALLLYMPVVALLTWDVVPERSRQLCLTLIDRAVAAIDGLCALEEFV